jgi:hypothetical protein
MMHGTHNVRKILRTWTKANS